MDTNIRTNIGGFIFNLDSNAYHSLENYFEKIKEGFQSPEEAEEISNDIEFRVAELLREQGMDEDTIVELSNIEELIKVLGYPDDELIDLDSEDAPIDGKRNHKLFRHPEDRYLGGVSGGFGAYFGINSNFIRILFVLLSLFKGFGLLLYGILWLVIPEAKTRVQLLQLRGKKANFDNLESAIKEEFDAVKTSFSTLKETKGFKQFPKIINTILKAIVNIIVFIFKAFALFIAFIALILSTAMLFAFITSLFFPSTVFSPIGWFNTPLNASFFHWIFPFGNILLLKLGILLFLGIPALFILMASIRVIFKLPYRNKKIFRATGLITWLVGFFILGSIGLNQRRAFLYESHQSKDYALKAFNSDTLYVDMDKIDMETLHIMDEEFELDNATWRVDGEEEELVGKAKIYFRVSNDDKFKIETEYRAAGISNKVADAYANNIDYQWQQQDSLVKLANYFALKDKSKEWRNQRVRVYIYIPEGKYVNIGKSMRSTRFYGIGTYGYYKHYRHGNVELKTNDLWLAQDGEFVQVKDAVKAENIEMEKNDETNEFIENRLLRDTIEGIDENEILEEMKEEIKK